ncbi:MAG: hypothetical protein ABFD18_14975 [Syntrophomonas sp.]
MARSNYFRVHLTNKATDKFRAVADKYGISVSALGSYLVIKFLSEQDKPDNLDDLIISIKPSDLWQAFEE